MIQSTFAGGVSPFRQVAPVVVRMGKVVVPATPMGKRAKGYVQTAEAICKYIEESPGTRAKVLQRSLGFSESRVKLVLKRMVDEGLLTKVRDATVLTTTYLYYTTGANIPEQPKTKRSAVHEFVAANPGVLRQKIYANFGKRNCACELCALVKAGVLRGELLSTGTHYYEIEKNK